MSEISQSGPVVELERRWSTEPSPQLTLQLAEEHHRLGNRERSIEVVREGLEHHPGHVSARVALGRYLFEEGETEGAVEELESIVQEDPTHLVANKLLVSVCMKLGERDRARDRLDLYKILNASDPDIEELEAKVSEAPVEEAPVAALDDGDSPDGEAPNEKAPGSASPVADAPAAEVQTSRDDPFHLGEVSAARSTGSSSGGARDPFGDIWSTPDQSSYTSALIGEGIFQLTESRQVDQVVAPEPEHVSELLSGPSLPEDSGETEQVEAAGQTSIDPEAAAPDSVESAEPAEATVTLGKLYLEQGYAEEAAGIFRAVLDREPDNPDAEAGLKASLGTDQELMAADLVDADGLAAASDVGRKRLVLEGYAARIRTASKKERDV